MTGSSTPALRVVVADDSPDLRRLLRLSLERAGVEVVAEAEDGLDAVEAALAHQPDAVLLDLAMPRMDGLEAIPRIQIVAPTARIVVLSGFDVGMMRDDALRRGAQAYLEKGCPPAEVVATLQRVCGVDTQSAPSWDIRQPQRSDLLSTLIHEVRNQMMLVDGYASILLSSWGKLGEDQRREYVERVLRNTAALRAIVDSVGAAERIDAGALSLASSHLHLAEVAREVIDDQAATDPEHRYVLHVDWEATVEADAMRVRQVLTNLLSNAAKFSPAQSTVTVTVRAEGGAGVLCVSDEGSGIPPESRETVFRPFARLGASAPGTGLGLWISREIARAHGGDLTLLDAPGGATFRLRLPVRQVASTPGTACSDHEVSAVEGD